MSQDDIPQSLSVVIGGGCESPRDCECGGQCEPCCGCEYVSLSIITWQRVCVGRGFVTVSVTYCRRALLHTLLCNQSSKAQSLYSDVLQLQRMLLMEERDLYEERNEGAPLVRQLFNATVFQKVRPPSSWALCGGGGGGRPLDAQLRALPPPAAIAHRWEGIRPPEKWRNWNGKNGYFVPFSSHFRPISPHFAPIVDLLFQ